MKIDDNTLLVIFSDGRLVESMKATEAPEELLMELVAGKILELSPTMDFATMSQKEADLISEPKD